jgi:hypothetical protein
MSPECPNPAAFPRQSLRKEGTLSFTCKRVVPTRSGQAKCPRIGREAQYTSQPTRAARKTTTIKMNGIMHLTKVAAIRRISATLATRLYLSAFFRILCRRTKMAQIIPT